MVEVPDALRALFAATVEERDGRYVVSVPRREVEHAAVAPGTVYQVALLPEVDAATDTATADRAAPDTPASEAETRSGADAQRSPPVEEGETRTVTVEATGDQGDGIAKVERGYVVIVPGTEPGDKVTVDLVSVHENFAMAAVVDDASD